MTAVRPIAQFEALDAPAQKLAKAVRAVIRPGPLKNALSGSWLGFLANAWVRWILTLLAVVELVTDQLPSTPSRTVPR